MKEISLDLLLNNLPKGISRSQKQLIKRAFSIADSAHKNQIRHSGEAYIIHPLSVAIILTEIYNDYESIVAALLHDVLEDTDFPKKEMEKIFGSTITQLVDGVTKITNIKKRSKAVNQAENIRKMIIGAVADPRVIIIKLADRLHNMRTLQYKTKEKANIISLETINIYTPLAGRLGIFKLKSELEDLAFSYIHPEEYKKIKKMIDEKKIDRDFRIEKIITEIKKELKKNKIKFTIEGRSKHFYSIFRKMKTKHKSFFELYDLSAIRIIVPDKQDCYNAMGVIYNLWKPLEKRFKDYIALPKPNGYQSIHITVLDKEGRPIEFQIRSQKMHIISEMGIAAHWMYKENVKKKFDNNDFLNNPVSSLEELGLKVEDDNISYLETLKEKLSNNEVYIHTPQGKIMSFIEGSIILDLAFKIHTDLGIHCSGAMIDGNMVSIRRKLISGEQVHIVTTSHAKPTLEWLNIVKTSHAKSKLRSWFKSQKIEIPPTISKQKKQFQNLSDKNIIENNDTISEKDNFNNKKKIHPTKKNKNEGHIIEWDGEKNVSFFYAKCCTPLPGDEILGYITKSRGISVHKVNCPHFKNLVKDAEAKKKIAKIKWSGLYDTFPVRIQIQAEDRQRLFLDIVTILTDFGANIIKAKAQDLNHQKIIDEFDIEVDSEIHLTEILEKIKELPSIISVKKV